MVLVAAAFAAASCGFPPPASIPRTAKLPHVLATTTFLADIAQNVSGTRLIVDRLLPVTADPHEYQPTPKDASSIAQSQVLIVNGLGYEAWLPNLLGTGDLQLQTITGSDGLQPRAGGDPHMWMDPLNVVHYAENIRDGLSTADPAGAQDYAVNAAAYVARLNDLNAWIKTEVAQVPPAKRLLVTNHDELGYFADAYGFKIVGAVVPSVTSDAAPSAQEMAGLIQTVKSSAAPAIFMDVNENQNLARQIASETGVKVVTGLYIESLSVKEGPAPTYIDMMQYDVTTIVDALR
jgi:ABC-type Zn uptake system ZnuABC Zn-binding protein ZnuA